ncbi:MAG TPA: hypothetical protein VK742_07785 [Candidatus Sulfotelmatobacter sp.]|nr:hypothetical protein [Candidatus Sulfotelmatobacter sp.]
MIKAFVLAAGIATVARAGLSYLPHTGPPPMRVAIVKSPARPPEPKIALVAVIPAHDTNSPAAVENCIADTNPIVISSKPSDDESKLPPIVLGADNAMQMPGPGPANGPAMMQLDTPDLMGITPAMLATYFRPNATGTNALVVPVPFRVGFVPPLAAPSSHSEYNVK